MVGNVADAVHFPIHNLASGLVRFHSVSEFAKFLPGVGLVLRFHSPRFHMHNTNDCFENLFCHNPLPAPMLANQN